MEAASGAVEFLSVECDMIFEPDCDLETECQADSEQEEEQAGDGVTSPSCLSPSPASPVAHAPLSVSELFKGRSVGVYRRSDPDDPFVLIFDPSLQPRTEDRQAGEASKGRWSSPEEDGEEGEGEGQGQGCRRPARCSVCLKQFRTRGCLVTHSLTHVQPSAEPPPPCPVCGAALPSRAALKIHVRRHFSMQTYQCPSCPQRHLTRTQLMVHQQLHTTQHHHTPAVPTLPSTPPHRQGQERLDSSPEAKPQPAKETNHTPEPDLRCERCDATFPTRTALWAHRKCHRERRHRRRRRHECPECGSQFWRSSALKKHRRAEHDV
ncbi:zinc finger protein 668-like [Portunus trituberculatus]|uniref:Zinc finger protein 484 n=1 Tax=Portunus trituberculatus TaxID=210409 RepID=A0A5B7FBX1_PORTR|nr:zinc finger protein 668-like [Portunus trituberculatus]XP_045123216.1 zinc finger protein 668-like [Portunus trituberculatus]MPC43057.1 Zinc finger protein 484 [Portunus trituberculatus]